MQRMNKQQTRMQEDERLVKGLKKMLLRNITIQRL
jgi:hypothetical protein